MFIKSAYIHIPFCKRRCFYCDFPVTVLGDNSGNHYSPWQKEYVDFLCQEIMATPKQNTLPLATVFFGGGTPSLLAIQGLEIILNTLNQHFGISKNAEISLEIDPATFNLRKLKQYQKLGINRVSLGLQAFQDNLLEICGRTHRLTDINQSIDWIHQANFDNWSLDLISGLPRQSLHDWQESLEKAIALQPKHLSCYDLVLEPVTVFGKKYAQGDNPLPLDETAAKMYCLASEILQKAGYNHYEISNYGKKGYECQHNQVYWHNESYHGFGMGAASYTNNKRFTRPRTRKEYFAWVGKYCQNLGIIDIPVTSKNDQLLETLMLGLRLKKGINLEKVKTNFGEGIADNILKSLDSFLEDKSVIFDENTHVLRLTDPQGFLYSNTVLTALFSTFDN
ncbi:radical SAM family heme chaperone HemW [Geminocystis sp. GBBB08]|uniref:radical SAM family heme chaperone HemW n=1 Tax=Geminocystis sp. GBBB08 TaxID=2604140 RepID=UPI0027E3453B|nr:radical SAM family heme chaperone HemW [Geminocystis sp. GBBB08]MBL1211659.1 coproporphyrinogen III oxidase [Geminocystis sp. GBBB08]